MNKITREQARLVQAGIIGRALSIIDAKRQDYSGGEDPFTNFRKIESLGVDGLTAELGALIRLMDKLSRIDILKDKPNMKGEVNENIVDTFADALNYLCIFAALCAERHPSLLKQFVDDAFIFQPLMENFID